MDKRMLKLLSILSDEACHTAEEMAATLEVGTKTVRNLIKDVNGEIQEHGAAIQSKYGMGYYLEFRDRAVYQTYLKQKQQAQEKNFIPTTSEERIQYLVEYLINHSEYIKQDKLSDSLYISKRTLTADLKEVEQFLNKFNIKLVRNSSCGIKVEGSEFDYRLCIASCSGKRFHKENQSMEEIGRCVSEVLAEENFKISGVSFQNLVVHLYIVMSRISENHCVPMPEEQKKSLEKRSEYKTACQVAKRLGALYGICFPESEIAYITIHLAGKSLIDHKQVENGNMVITQEISDLVVKMLESVYEAYRFDFRDDLELRMILCQHLVPLKVRIQYDMEMKNPFLTDVKKKFCLSYTMASHAATVINEYFHTTLSEDEISYFTFAFALALERMRTERPKKNILLVCASGQGSARLLQYKYEKLFGPYLGKVTACDVGNLPLMEFSEYDYIFTTIPIPYKVPLPIQEVGYFLDEENICQVTKTLIRDKSIIETYYREDLFLPNLKAESQGEVLRLMCSFVMDKLGLPEEFYESVLERERAAQTAFGNLVAMPHCYKAMSDETFVCLAVLEQPILWGKEFGGEERKVQAVFLVSIANKDQTSTELQRFYQATASFMLNPKDVKDLIRNRDFSMFMQRMRELEETADQM